MEDSDYKELVESFGGRAVGLSFNPSKLLAVQVIKTDCANLINELNQSRTETEDGEVKRMFALAITHLQEAQMWAVKAVTWGK